MEFIHSFLSKWVVPCIYVNPNMKNLKRKVEYLSATVDDLETEFRLAEYHPAKRPRKEAQHWRRNAREIIESISRLEEKVDRVGQWMFVSRLLLGKEVEEKIQEVVELQEQHNFPRGVLIDAPPTSEQFIPIARFFCGGETVTARNKGKYLMDDELSNGNHQRWQPPTPVTNQYQQPPPLNTSKVATTAVRPCPTSPVSHLCTGDGGGMYGCGRGKRVVMEGWGGDEGEREGEDGGRGVGRVIRVADMGLGEGGRH
ncbi:hypothetical protein LOK49_LG02G03211 [Camellia lanceoleosa]|uniref:Uncharacterized protein n=1 Tax=Camellia lanceoleosa TaxID=1840588 RepID=A0ACC0IWI7_9ERIC|nr:hypothetical protein LOK49_LG02G03211 [Camellia lanceoleosa]